ncbi:hypothetical protein HRbin26_00539 [bacterium HR26]|nr:hypothetical protein HRbin26_00539 [bacterium HR26]
MKLTTIPVELIHLVTRYLEGTLTLDEFEHAFITSTWDSDRLSHGQTKSFIYDVEHALVEHRADLLSEEELRRELTSRIEQARMSMLDGADNRERRA